MNYLKKIFPVLILSGSLIFVGMSAGSNAEAATTISSLNSSLNTLKTKVKSLENKVKELTSCVNKGFVRDDAKISDDGSFNPEIGGLYGPSGNC